MTEEILADLRAEMDGTTTALRRELARTRTGRASTSLLEGISIDYYGTKTPLNQLAGVTVPEPRLLVIQPYDKGALGEIEKAIMNSDLGLTPVNDGKLLRLPIPELTEDRRRELVRHVRKIGEDYRVSMRSHRRDSIDLLKQLEKDKEITEDDLRKGQEKVQEITDASIASIDEVLKKKEAEIMEV